MRQVLCCICVFLAGLLPLAAQSGSGGDRSRKPGRSAWFACTSIPDGLENPVKVMTGEDITELELPRYMASEPVKIPEDGVIRIVRVEMDPGDPGKVKYIVLAQAQVPAQVREALIILVPLAEPEGDLLFSAKVQDLAAFNGGDRLYINLSDTPVRITVGKTEVTVAPKKAGIYAAPVLAKPTNTPIMYKFYHPERKKWMILSASTVVLRPTRREICVFNEGSRIGSIKKHKILFPLPVKER
jgi:hypothetical protein